MILTVGDALGKTRISNHRVGERTGWGDFSLFKVQAANSYLLFFEVCGTRELSRVPPPIHPCARRGFPCSAPSTTESAPRRARYRTREQSRHSMSASCNPQHGWRTLSQESH